jgi:DNA-binding LytR/AlgR family response regulator
MRVMIIEDEYFAAKSLESTLSSSDRSIYVSAITGSIKDSIEILKNDKPDLIFMDIHLSDGLSFSIFDQLDIEIPVVFTTAYDKYAINAFNYHCIDYLLKPIKKEDVEKSLSKFDKIKSLSHADIAKIVKSIDISNNTQYRERFLIQVGNLILKIDSSEISYVYADKKNVIIKTYDNKELPVNYTLEKLESMLDPKNFFRINRKMIVNIRSISKMTAYSRRRVKLEIAHMSNDVDSVVSVEKSSKFRQWIEG